jgi:hypothetical protein
MSAKVRFSFITNMVQGFVLASYTEFSVRLCVGATHIGAPSTTLGVAFFKPEK